MLCFPFGGCGFLFDFLFGLMRFTAFSTIFSNSAVDGMSSLCVLYSFVLRRIPLLMLIRHLSYCLFVFASRFHLHCCQHVRICSCILSCIFPFENQDILSFTGRHWTCFAFCSLFRTVLMVFFLSACAMIVEFPPQRCSC